MKKIFFPVLVSISAVLLAACSGPSGDVTLETAFPEDASMLFGMDVLDEDAIAEIKALFDEEDLQAVSAYIAEEFNFATDGLLSYEEDIAPIFGGGFKMAFGGNFDGVAEDFTAIPNIYFVGQFNNIDLIENLFETGEENNEEMEVSKRKGAKIWSPDPDIFFAITGDYLIVTLSEENIDAALDRLNGEAPGFVWDDEMQKEIDQLDVEGREIGYYFLDTAGDDDLKELFGQAQGPIDRIYGVMGLDGNVSTAEAVIYLSEDAQNLGLFREYDVHLVDKVPSEGVMLYSEFPSFEPYMRDFVASYTLGADLDFTYEQALGRISEASGIEVAQMREIFDSPFAMTFGDSGELVPYMMFYIEMTDDVEESAKEFVNGFNQYVDEVISEFDQFVVPFGIEPGVLKREVEIVQGGAVNKLYFDTTVLNEQTRQSFEFMSGLAIDEINPEFYYGVTGDGMMVMGLYPGFAQAYDGTPLAESEAYKKAMEMIDVEDFDTVAYFSMDPLTDYLSRLPFSIESPAAKGFIGMIDSFGYSIGVSQVDGNVVRTTSYGYMGK